MKLYRTTQYRTETYLIDKAKSNKTVDRLMIKHYKELHKLVINKLYEDIFNDTYLIMTVKYQPDKDFIQEFKYQYYYLYRRFQLLNFGKYEYSPKLENGQDYISSVADLVNDSNIVDNPVNDAVDTNSDLTNNALIQELKEYAVNEMKQDLARRITKYNKT